jgi:hypothetical protein
MELSLSESLVDETGDCVLDLSTIAAAGLSGDALAAALAGRIAFAPVLVILFLVFVGGKFCSLLEKSRKGDAGCFELLVLSVVVLALEVLMLLFSLVGRGGWLAIFLAALGSLAAEVQSTSPMRNSSLHPLDLICWKLTLSTSM